MLILLVDLTCITYFTSTVVSSTSDDKELSSYTFLFLFSAGFFSVYFNSSDESDYSILVSCSSGLSFMTRSVEIFLSGIVNFFKLARDNPPDLNNGGSGL